MTIDWDKVLSICDCGHSIHKDHFWHNSKSGGYRGCYKCGCWHSSFTQERA